MRFMIAIAPSAITKKPTSGSNPVDCRPQVVNLTRLDAKRTLGGGDGNRTHEPLACHALSYLPVRHDESLFM